MAEYDMRWQSDSFCHRGVSGPLTQPIWRVDGPFRQSMVPHLNRTETVLTLRSEDVIGAEGPKGWSQNSLHGARAGRDMGRPARRTHIP
jgi:hypothetical protein